MELNILKIASSGANTKKLNNFTHSAFKKNHICGDYIDFKIYVKNNCIHKISFETKSCVYCQASASLLSRKSKNKKIDEINEFLNTANFLFQDNSKIVPKHWRPFNTIFKKQNLSRKECLLLPVNALMKIIKKND